VKAATQLKWPTSRLRFLLNPGLTHGQREKLLQATQVSFLPMEAIGEQGELDLSTIRNLDEVKTGYTQFFDGDVIVAKITPCFENGKGALARDLFNGVGFGTTELYVLSPGPELDGRFLYYVTKSSSFKKLGEATMTGAAGQKRVPEEFVRNFRVVLPSLPQQHAMADFLDRETAKIDALIAAKEHLLGILAEKRRALITHTATRGPNPDAPFRDSATSWLGQIPSHWRIAGFTKYLRSIVDYRGKTPAKTQSGVFLVTARNIRDGFIDYTTSQEFIEPDVYEETMKRGKPKIGDILLTTEAPLGQAALVDREDIALAQRVIKLDYDSNVLLNEFVLAWIRSEFFQWQLNSFATGSTALGIKGERLHMLQNVIPPIDEQLAIVAHIKQETAKLDTLRQAAEKTIGLLKERRAALIAAAVTGKIAVSDKGEIG
jgi:type I restriction enzyme, S subunit